MLGYALGLLWLLALGAWLSLHPALHADALYLHDLLQTLQAGRGLGGWDLPPAPSLFPDLGLLRLAYAFSDNLVEAQRLYGLAMGLLLWLLLARLLRPLLGLSKSLSRAHSAAGLLLALLLLPAGSGVGDWMQPSHHGMALLGSLWLWSWVLLQKEQASGWAATLGVGVGLGLMAQSDRLLWVWGAMPLALLALRLKGPGRLRVLGLLLLAALVSALAQWAMERTGARIATARWSYIFSRSAADWKAVLGQLPGLLQAHLGLALAATLALGLWLRPQARRHSGPRVLLLGWALAALASLGVASLLGSFSPRYLTLLLWLPVALLPVFLAERSEAWEKPALLLPLLGALLLLGSQKSAAQASGPLEQQRAAALDAELGPRGLRYGWADYWQARPLRLLSGQGLLLAPVISDARGVDPYLWIGERGLFMQGDVLNKPQFVVSNGLDPAALQARLGTPPEIVTVQDLTVWLLVRGAKP